jgi:hypothetical protein
MIVNACRPARLDWLERAGLAVRKLDAGAGAALHELPGVALEVDGRGALAGRAGAGGAIVLALQRDAEALLLVGRGRCIRLGLSEGSGGGKGGKRSRNGGGKDKRADESSLISPHRYFASPPEASGAHRLVRFVRCRHYGFGSSRIRDVVAGVTQMAVVPLCVPVKYAAIGRSLQCLVAMETGPVEHWR